MFASVLFLLFVCSVFSLSFCPVFVSLSQRFFKYLCIASKVEAAVAIAKDATEYGKVSLRRFTHKTFEI